MTTTLPELVTQITTKLTEAFTSLKRSLEFYREAGRLLAEAKKELKAKYRKPWNVWVESPEGPGIDHRVAQFYMRLHKKWKHITSHPDFNPNMGYVAALKLVKKDRQGKQKIAGATIGVTAAVPNAALASLVPKRAIAAKDGDTAVSVLGVPAPMLLPTFEPQAVPMLPNLTEEAETALSVQSVPRPTLLALPAPEPEALPKLPAINVIAQISGEADLLVTPSIGFDLDQVMSMVAKNEATFQEQSGRITKPNAEVIATFTARLRTWTINNLAASALAA